MSAEQLTCVPPTVEELLSAYRARLVEDMESAAGRAVKANTKMDEACEALKMFDGAMRAVRDPEDGMTDEEAADALVAAVFEDELPVNMLEAAADMATPATIATDVDVTCADCGGEGRLPDRTGGGQHRCKACAGTGSLVKHVTLPAVGVFRPGDDFPTITDVGPLTRFAELIADYLTESASADEIADYRICSADDGTELDRMLIIGPELYGRQFVVERRASEMAVSSTGSGQIGDAMPSKGDDGSDASAAPESPAAS